MTLGALDLFLPVAAAAQACTLIFAGNRKILIISAPRISTFLAEGALSSCGVMQAF